MKTARRLSDQQTHKPGDYYYYQYKIEENYYELAEFELKRGRKSNVEKIANNLDRFYISEKLKFYLKVLSQKQFINDEYTYLFIEDIIKHIETHDYENVPQIAIYYQIVLMLTDKENKTYYYKLKELLDKYVHLFSKGEAEEMYTAAINYCIGYINKGSREFLEELFYLNEAVLKNAIIFVDGKLLPWHFKNFVIVALRLDKFEWTANFIKTYKNQIQEEFRDNAVNFNLARLYFYQKKYDESIILLQTVEYDDVFYGLDSKTLLLQSYYELDEIEPLYSLLDSFRAYLNRNKKLPPNRKQNYLRLISFLKKLIKIPVSDQSQIKKLQEEINTAKGIASGEWLKSKIEGLL